MSLSFHKGFVYQWIRAKSYVNKTVNLKHSDVNISNQYWMWEKKEHLHITLCGVHTVIQRLYGHPSHRQSPLREETVGYYLSHTHSSLMHSSLMQSQTQAFYLVLFLEPESFFGPSADLYWLTLIKRKINCYTCKKMNAAKLWIW